VLYIVPDTNFFLHFKDYDQLPWKELFTDHKEFTVLVPMQVIKELDKHKNNSSSRKSKRARHTLSKLNPSKKNDLCSHSTAIDFKYLDTGKEVFDSSLDGDDLIIEQFEKWRELNPESVAILISGDTGMAIKCQGRDIPFKSLFEVNNDWRLDPEPNEEQKKIKALESELSILKNRQPKIEISFDESDKEVLLNTFSQPTPDEISTFKEYLKSTYPIAAVSVCTEDEVRNHLGLRKGFENLGSSLYHKFSPEASITVTGITQAEITKYQQKYEDWLSSTSFETRDLMIHQKTMVGKFSFSIKNTGIVPASKLYISIENNDGLIFDPYLDDEDRENLEKTGNIESVKGIINVINTHRTAIKKLLPPPPSPPVSHFKSSRLASALVSQYASSPDYSVPENNNYKKDNCFYCTDGRKETPTNILKYDCPKFFHEEEILFTFYYIITDVFQESEIIIHFDIQAENLPKRIKKIVKISLNRSQQLSIFDYLKELDLNNKQRGQ